jgi:hypothetical protein
MRASLTATAVVLLTLACGDTPTTPGPTGETITLSQAQVDSITTRGDVVADANPGNTSLRSFVDSTLEALQAGVVMQRLDVSTNLTTNPLYFIGIHRVVNQSGGSSFSTWTLIGFEDPADFRRVVEVSGFAQSSTGTAPTSVNGTIGNGGFVNGQLLVVAANGSVSTFNYSSGSVSFRSDAPSGPCPKTNPSPATVCTLETMHVQFNVSATQTATGSLERHASVATEVAVPTMRLTYTP